MSEETPVVISAEEVEKIFGGWVQDLLANHHDRLVADVLDSPAIQSMFTGDVGQSAGPVKLKPEEDIALAVALAQLRRGEDPTPNVAAACVLGLARLAGRL